MRTWMPIEDETFRRLGNDTVAYVRKMNVNEARKQHPKEQDIPAKGLVYVLYLADGGLIAVERSNAKALERASEYDLDVLPTH